MTQQQHVQIYRKIGLRRSLLVRAEQGAAFIPFCGDGDLALELYTDRPMYGCDMDPARVATVRERIPQGHWSEADADNADQLAEIFGSTSTAFAVADFDSYAYPYASFRAFWAHAPLADRVVVFFTDAQRNSMFLNGTYRSAATGATITIPQDAAVGTKRRRMQRYLLEELEPWLRKTVAPATVTKVEFYNRGQMLYWGAVIEIPNVPNVEAQEGVVYQRGEAISQNGDHIADLSADDLGYSPLRRERFDAKRKRRLLRLIADGETRTAACRKVGISLRTLNRHIDQYATFADEVYWCEQEAIDEIENALYLTAKSGNVTAQRFYLANKRPEKWRDGSRLVEPARPSTEALGQVTEEAVETAQQQGLRTIDLFDHAEVMRFTRDLKLLAEQEEADEA